MKNRKFILLIFTISVLTLVLVIYAYSLNSKKEIERTITLSDGGITYTGTGISIQDSGSTLSNNVAVINATGTYTVSGTISNGIIIVDADDAYVTLNLKDVNLTSVAYDAIYVKNAASVTINVPKNTTSYVTSGNEEYKEAVIATKTGTDSDLILDKSYVSSEYSSAVYANSELVFTGEGKLTVTGYINNAVQSANAVIASDLDLNVESVGTGIKCGTNMDITSGYLNVHSYTAGISADNNMNVDGGAITINSEESGICVLGKMFVTDGKITVNGSSRDKYGLQVGEGTTDSYLQVNGGTLIISELLDNPENNLMLNLTSNSKQSIAICTADEGELWPAGTILTIIDSRGKSLASTKLTKASNVIIISNSEILSDTTLRVKTTAWEEDAEYDPYANLSGQGNVSDSVSGDGTLTFTEIPDETPDAGNSGAGAGTGTVPDAGNGGVGAGTVPDAGNSGAGAGTVPDAGNSGVGAGAAPDTGNSGAIGTAPDTGNSGTGGVTQSTRQSTSPVIVPRNFKQKSEDKGTYKLYTIISIP